MGSFWVLSHTEAQVSASVLNAVSNIYCLVTVLRNYDHMAPSFLYNITFFIL